VVARQHFHGHDTVIDLLLADQTPVSARVLDDQAPFVPGTRVQLEVAGSVRAFEPVRAS
jgi:hypothetical protein